MRTASKSSTAIQVAYCRVSARSSRRQRCSRSTCCDGSSVAASEGSSSAQSSGFDFPVPRWSMNTMSRRAFSSAKIGIVMPMTRVAACPGPPAKTNTGSGCLLRATAGTTAKWMSIFRPAGASGSSGIDTDPHRISRSTPGRRHGSSPSARGPAPGRQAASTSTAASTSAEVIECMNVMGSGAQHINAIGPVLSQTMVRRRGGAERRAAGANGAPARKFSVRTRP